jgi:O-Antigen ligase
MGVPLTNRTAELTLPGPVAGKSPAAYSWKNAIAWLIAAAAVTALALKVAPVTFDSGDDVFVIAVASIFLVLICVTVGLGAARQVATDALVYRLMLLIWWYVLICEVVFGRTGDSYRTYAGEFAIQAYGEGVIWVLAFLVLLILSLREPAYLGQFFTGSYKWVSLLTLVCLLSVARTPGKLYAAAWGFKLLLVVMLLRFCASLIRTPDDVVRFLKTSFWGFFVLTVVPVLIAFSDPATAFGGVGGRLNADPDLLSATAASLLLLALTLYSIEGRKFYLFTSLIATIVMFLALGKAGVIAGILGVIVFFLLQKRVGRSLGFLLCMAVLGMVVLLTTPVANHLRSYQGVSTFTGRTEIWAAGINGIRQSPIFGHGYLASYFFIMDAAVGGDKVALQGMHLHNGFLDIGYNCGLVGLALLVIIHWIIVRNLWRTLRAGSAVRSRRRETYLLAVGLLAVYVNLLVAGLFNASFGGRPMSPYMLFLAVSMFACELPRLGSKPTGSVLPSTGGVARHWQPEVAQQESKRFR